MLAGRGLSARGWRISNASQALAERFKRSPETIRQTFLAHNERHPEDELFPSKPSPISQEGRKEIYRRYNEGESPSKLAEEYDRSRTSIHRIIAEERARRIRNRTIKFIYSPEFDMPDADERILGEPADIEIAGKAEPVENNEVTSPLSEICNHPLLSKRMECTLFRRYNYLKFKAREAINALDPLHVRTSRLDEIDTLLGEATLIKKQLVEMNLRLVVSVARRHAGKHIQMPELVSDGALSLMRAADNFDYSRGYRFSTYASWALMKSYARSVPAENYGLQRFHYNHEALEDLADSQEKFPDLERKETTVSELLEKLKQEERHIIERHFGLADGKPISLEEIGKELGFSRRKVRRIETKAFAKIRRWAETSEPDIEVLVT
jgi:RNA polymerase sigma factor (sigma-70 family)